MTVAISPQMSDRTTQKVKYPAHKQWTVRFEGGQQVVHPQEETSGAVDQQTIPHSMNAYVALCTTYV